MLECTLDNTKNKVTVKISGDMTVLSTGALYRKLLELSETADEVELELDDIENADMTFFQLLCSAHRSFVAKDKTFSVSGNKKTLYERKEFTGFIRHKGCSKDKLNDCVLVKEK